MPTVKDGSNGENGADGYTYETVDESFGNGSSATSYSDVTWGVAPQNGKYRWRRYKIKKYRDGETPTISDYHYECVGYVGTDGVSTYTWVKYADSIGTGGYPEPGKIYDIPQSTTKYIGFAFNKTSPYESENPQDYQWSKYVGENGDPGEPAKYVMVLGEQVFVYPERATGAVPSKLAITLTAVLNGGLSAYQWYYKPGDSSTFTKITNATTNTLLVQHDSSWWNNKDVCTFRCTSNNGIYDEMTLAKVYGGTDGVSIILSNENHTFEATTDSALPASTNCYIWAYKGNSLIPVSIDKITGAPTKGLTATAVGSGSKNARIDVVVNSDLHEAGVLTLKLIIDGKVVERTFTWSLAFKGATGEQGPQGPQGEQGDAGQSVSMQGDWHSGLFVPYLGLVRFGTATYCCINTEGSYNPPIGTYIDDEDNRYVYSDGSYVLSGGVSEDYELVAQDGSKGDTGSNGADGLNGLNGKEQEWVYKRTATGE
ncbi:MAG: hypothetical protein HUJ56_12565, partial [Erysipelotrichaceae bacterium]|nr:hypothetical protein [Erysipelotrichaceae bacterium]